MCHFRKTERSSSKKRVEIQMRASWRAYECIEEAPGQTPLELRTTQLTPVTPLEPTRTRPQLAR